MAKVKLQVVRDQEAEDDAKVQVESCSAIYDGTTLRIIGECRALNGKKISDYRTMQFTVYDNDGDIIERNYTNWSAFGVLQSFEYEFCDLASPPIKVKVFPTK